MNSINKRTIVNLNIKPLMKPGPGYIMSKSIYLERQIIGTKFLLLVVLSKVTIVLGISTILKGKKDNKKV